MSFPLSLLCLGLAGLLPGHSPLAAATDPYADVITRVEALRGEEGAFISSIGRSVKDRPIYAVFLTDARDATPIASERTRIMVLCGQHGGERTPVRAALGLAEELAKAPDCVPGRPLRGVVMAVIPVVNPDGFVTGRRANSAGQDLNRDWTNISQPETAAVWKLSKWFRPHLVIDLHEWSRSDPHRPDCVEVAGFGADPGSRLGRLLADEIGSRIALKAVRCHQESDGRLAHRRFAGLGIAGMLVETSPNASEAAQARAYRSLLLSALASLTNPRDVRIGECLRTVYAERPEADARLETVCRLAPADAPIRQAPWWPAPAVGIGCLLLHSSGRRKAARQRLALPRAARGGVRLFPVALTDLVQADIPVGDRLALMGRCRVRPSDRGKAVSGRQVGDQFAANLSRFRASLT